MEPTPTIIYHIYRLYRPPDKQMVEFGDIRFEANTEIVNGFPP